MHILHGGRGGRDVYFAAVHEFRNIEDPHPVCGDYARGSSESTALVREAGVFDTLPQGRRGVEWGVLPDHFTTCLTQHLIVFMFHSM